MDEYTHPQLCHDAGLKMGLQIKCNQLALEIIYYIKTATTNNQEKK